VKKQTGSGPATVFVYDATGTLAAEYGAAGAVTGTQYLVADHLGSTRMAVDATGAVQALHDYLPFGEEIPAGTGGRTAIYGGADGVAEKFTGKERDSELASSAMQGLDYFGARYFSGTQGRWTSPDWSPIQQPVPYANLQDPQTLNLYAYVRNNPLSKVDPDGHNWWNKFKNVFTGAECYCEGDEANARKALRQFRHAQINKSLNEAEQKQLAEMVTTTVYFGVEEAALSVAGSGNAVADANEASEEMALVMINGRLPINSGYAGGTHPTGVPFTAAGFPDFSSYAVAEVRVTGLTGNNTKDAALANQATGLPKTPAGYTWHHVEDGKTMQLVPTSVHQPVGHTGGAAVIRNGGTDK
jgi:RHS repeat-associated protein